MSRPDRHVMEEAGFILSAVSWTSHCWIKPLGDYYEAALAVENNQRPSGMPHVVLKKWLACLNSLPSWPSLTTSYLWGEENGEEERNDIVEAVRWKSDVGPEQLATRRERTESSWDQCLLFKSLQEFQTLTAYSDTVTVSIVRNIMKADPSITQSGIKCLHVKTLVCFQNCWQYLKQIDDQYCMC